MIVPVASTVISPKGLPKSPNEYATPAPRVTKTADLLPTARLPLKAPSVAPYTV